VTVPGRRGFGTRLIERQLAAEFGGAVSLDFRPTGVVCAIDAPLETPEPAGLPPDLDEPLARAGGGR
jgi:two-component sensor histidine kinase